MNDKTWWTWLSGAAFFVLGIILLAISGGEPPMGTEDSTQEILTYYSDNKDQLMVGVPLGVLATGLLVYFGAHLRDALRPAGKLAPVILAGTIIVATGLAIDATIQIALVDIADDPDVAIAPATVQALAVLFDNDFIPMALGIFVYGTSAGLAIIRHGVVPRWLGWVALVFGLFVLIPHEVAFIGFIGMFLWTAVVSIYMAVQAKKGLDRVDTRAAEEHHRVSSTRGAE